LGSNGAKAEYEKETKNEFFTIKYKRKSAELPYFIQTKSNMSTHHVFIATSLDGYIADVNGAVHF